jgi:hypothetical protein
MGITFADVIGDVDKVLIASREHILLVKTG